MCLYFTQIESKKNLLLKILLVNCSPIVCIKNTIADNANIYLRGDGLKGISL